MVQYMEMKKVTSEFPDGIIEDFLTHPLAIIDCNGNSQSDADYSGDVGNQAARRDLCALHCKNMPAPVHQYMQSDGNPYIEFPFNIHPTEIESTDKGYTESSKRRKDVVTLIKVYGAKKESRQYDRPEEACFGISEKQPEHKSPEYQLLLESGKDRSVINHGECQLCIEVSEQRKYKIKRKHAQEGDSKSFENIAAQPENRKRLFGFDNDYCQHQSSKSQEQGLYRQAWDRVPWYIEKSCYKAEVSPEEDYNHACDDGIEYPCCLR